MLRKLLSALRPARATGPVQPGEIAGRERYEGYELLARPIREGGVWRVAGSVRLGEDDAAQTQDFVRADTIADRDEAIRMCLLKARQLVDERGRGLFGKTP